MIIQLVVPTPINCLLTQVDLLVTQFMNSLTQIDTSLTEHIKYLSQVKFCAFSIIQVSITFLLGEHRTTP